MKTFTKRAISEFNPDINELWVVRKIVDDAFDKPLPAVYGYLISKDTPEMPPRTTEQDEHGCLHLVFFRVNRVLEEVL